MVSVIDAKTRKIIKTIGFAVPGVQPEYIQPVGVRVTKDGSKAFVALGPANRVAVIDGKTLEVEQYLLVGKRVWQLAFTPDESLAVRDQRQQQRRVGDRRGELESREVGPGRQGPVGRHGLAALRGDRQTGLRLTSGGTSRGYPGPLHLLTNSQLVQQGRILDSNRCHFAGLPALKRDGALILVNCHHAATKLTSFCRLHEELRDQNGHDPKRSKSRHLTPPTRESS